MPRSAALFASIALVAPSGLSDTDFTVKDLQNHPFAGDLTIAVGDAADYSSVMAGDLEAAPFAESHGGLFRSFEKRGSGRYKLHVHVGAGDLTLR